MLGIRGEGPLDRLGRRRRHRAPRGRGAAALGEPDGRRGRAAPVGLRRAARRVQRRRRQPARQRRRAADAAARAARARRRARRAPRRGPTPRARRRTTPTAPDATRAVDARAAAPRARSPTSTPGPTAVQGPRPRRAPPSPRSRKQRVASSRAPPTPRRRSPCGPSRPPSAPQPEPRPRRPRPRRGHRRRRRSTARPAAVRDALATTPPVSSASPDAREVRHRMALADPAFSEKTDEQKAITEMVRQFVDEQILPNAEHYDHEDEFPEPIVEQMKELGLFGVTIPEEYGGMGLDLTTYAMIVEELSRGWISISGRRQHPLHRLLPADEVRHRRAEGAPAAADGDRRDPRRLHPLRARAGLRRAGDQDDRARSSTTATTRSTARRCGSPTACSPALVFVLVKTDRDADPPPQGHDLLHLREGAGRARPASTPGLTVPPKIKKMGYKGVESTELVFDGYRCPAEHDPRRRGGRPRQGLRADDGRARGRPRQRRRARRRHRPARARARAPLRAGAQDVRQADRRAPGDPVQARRHGHARSRPRAC